MSEPAKIIQVLEMALIGQQRQDYIDLLNFYKDYHFFCLGNLTQEMLNDYSVSIYDMTPEQVETEIWKYKKLIDEQETYRDEVIMKNITVYKICENLKRLFNYV